MLVRAYLRINKKQQQEKEETITLIIMSFPMWLFEKPSKRIIFQITLPKQSVNKYTKITFHFVYLYFYCHPFASFKCLDR